MLQYYEGIWAAAVLVMFTLLAFNGVVFAMLTEERALSRRQLMLVHSPLLRWLARPLFLKGWTAGSFKTSGEVDAQRVALQTLGTRLAVLSITSSLCKSASAATSPSSLDTSGACDGFSHPNHASCSDCAFALNSRACA